MKLFYILLFLPSVLWAEAFVEPRDNLQGGPYTKLRTRRIETLAECNTLPVEKCRNVLGRGCEDYQAQCKNHFEGPHATVRHHVQYNLIDFLDQTCRRSINESKEALADWADENCTGGASKAYFCFYSLHDSPRTECKDGEYSTKYTTLAVRCNTQNMNFYYGSGPRRGDYIYLFNCYQGSELNRNDED
jgi:hypothetical protein